MWPEEQELESSPDSSSSTLGKVVEVEASSSGLGRADSPVEWNLLRHTSSLASLCSWRAWREVGGRLEHLHAGGALEEGALPLGGAPGGLVALRL